MVFQRHEDGNGFIEMMSCRMSSKTTIKDVRFRIKWIFNHARKISISNGTALPLIVIAITINITAPLKVQVIFATG